MGKNLSVIEQNAKTIADLIADPTTPDSLRIQMINKLLESKKKENIFEKMFSERISFGACPKCNHETHWLIPEVDLNKMGYVSHERDSRVKQFTKAEDCPKWEEACMKKRVSV